jgi:sugar lactone lactonase YvrE
MSRTRVVMNLLLACGAALIPGLLHAEKYVISTVAGGAPPLTPAPGVEVSIAPQSVATDAKGSAYFASLGCVFKLDDNGVVTRIAGNARAGYSGDDGPATDAQLNSPAGVAVDDTGNVFIADSANHRIRKVLPDGIIVTVAGNGTEGFSGDGGPATSARVSSPTGVAVDGAGNLFIADRNNHRIRKVSPGGIIATVAGGGLAFPGDGGPATGAQLNEPRDVALDSAGNLFIADWRWGLYGSVDGIVRKVYSDGIITTAAGGGTAWGSLAEEAPATTVRLTYSLSLTVDGAGYLFIADLARIRKVSPDGIIATVVGKDKDGFSGDGGPATDAQLSYAGGVAVDRAGTLFIADTNNRRIRRVSTSGIITTVAGNGTYGFSGDGGLATSAQLSVGGSDPSAMGGLAFDGAGNLFIADTHNHRVRKVSPSGTITTIAGNGTRGFSGDAGPAASAQLRFPNGVAVDDRGNLFIADYGNSRIRKVFPSGVITTVAGNGAWGFSGDGEPATSAELGGPTGVAVDGTGNLFIADSNNWRIRKVSPGGIITTVAGAGFISGSSEDGIPATDAKLYWQCGGLAVDRAGNLFIAACLGGRVRKVSPDGIITTVAGGGTLRGASADGGLATSASLRPVGVAVDSAGNLFIATADFDWDVSGGDERIHKVSAEGIITVIAGTGAYGFSGDGGLATDAQLAGPAGVAADDTGNVYFVDTGNKAVRVLRPTTGPF